MYISRGSPRRPVPSPVTTLVVQLQGKAHVTGENPPVYVHTVVIHYYITGTKDRVENLGYALLQYMKLSNESQPIPTAPTRITNVHLLLSRNPSPYLFGLGTGA